MNIYNPLSKNINFNNSIFLAGPIKRNKNNEDWHEEAYNIFLNNYNNLNINIITPKISNTSITDKNLVNQVEWEKNPMENSNIIMFWIQRNLKDMIGLSTQFELGYWYAKNPDKLIIGIPDNAEKVRYLKKFINDKIIFNTLEETINNSIKNLNIKILKRLF